MNAIAGGSLPEIQFTPLDWDQEPKSVYCLAIKNVGVYGIYQLGSALYTPLSSKIFSLLASGKPLTWNVDLKYTLSYQMTLFVKLIIFDV